MSAAEPVSGGDSPMSARDVIADHIDGYEGEYLTGDGMAESILSALSEAGYTVARLEPAGSTYAPGSDRIVTTYRISPDPSEPT